MTRKFETRIKWGFAGIALSLAFIIALAIANSQQLRKASEAAARSEETLRELERLLVTMVDAETGMRGYLITGETPYLEPYNHAIATVDHQLRRLKELVEGSRTGTQYEDLERAVRSQLSFRKGIVERIRAGGGAEGVRRGIRLDEGKRGMDEVRKIIARLENSEEQALAERRRRADSMDKRAVGMLVLFVLVTVGLLGAGMMLVKHHLAARTRMEEERNRFFTLSPDMYFIAGTDGYFKEANPAAERILGYSSEELRTKPFIEFVHPEDREKTIAEASQVYRGKGTVYFENRYRTKDGSYRWLLWSSAVVLEEKLIYAVARDITEHKKTEERVAQLGDEARQRAGEMESLNKELEAFSYSVSHDLRAPLRHIAGFSDMLQRHADGSLDEKGKRYLNTIVESAKRMGLLIDDLLVFSRMGRAEFRRESVDLNRMVDEIIGELAPDIGNRRVNWKRQTLPTVVGDRAMLKQVFINLLSNALKYSAPREATDVEIGSRTEADEHVFYVKDNGVGFDMAYAHKLFGVFQRLHEASQFEGTGIGLANVRRIVARHGGRTWAEAELDKGATFYFSLPTAKTHAAA